MIKLRRRLLGLWRILVSKNFILITGMRTPTDKNHYRRCSLLNRTDFNKVEEYLFIDQVHEYYKGRTTT